MSQIKKEERSGISVLQLRGQFIGGDETDELRSILSEAAEHQQSKLIVNLENVSYLNSTALGVLISAHTNFVKRDGKIALCNVSKSIENIFVITKLTLVFSIYATLDEAVQQLS
ncbi:MAG: STAS domain-containing protein [Candidatus Kapaibacterium sp.]